MLRLLAVAALVVLCFAVAERDPLQRLPPRTDRTPFIDEVAGTYRGVGLGDSTATIDARLFEARPQAQQDGPFSRDDQGIPGFGPPRRATNRGAVIERTFEHVQLYVLDSVGAYAVTTIDPAAETQRGIGVRDSLDDVRRAYPNATCGEQEDDETTDGYDYCEVRIRSDRFVWFGGDPIRSISLFEESLTGPDFG